MQPWLSTVAAQLPFHALAVHSEQLDKIREEEVRVHQLVTSGQRLVKPSMGRKMVNSSEYFLFQARLEKENTNPITFEWLVRSFATLFDISKKNPPHSRVYIFSLRCETTF